MTKNTEKSNQSVYNQGDIYLIKVYYQLTDKTKIRPVVIVSNQKAIDLDVLISPITGQAARNEFDVAITKWREAGLEKPSVARTSKITMIHNSILYKKIGELDSTDLKNVLEKCKECFN